MPGNFSSLVGELYKRGAGDLGIHTEMLVDGMIDPNEAGKVAGAYRAIDR